MAYAASKSAMLNLTKSQAKKYAPEIRVNALCPALLVFREEDDAVYSERTIAKSALKIVPGFDAAIEAICYLQTNRYTTGSVLPLDGGRPLGMPELTPLFRVEYQIPIRTWCNYGQRHPMRVELLIKTCRL